MDAHATVREDESCLSFTGVASELLLHDWQYLKNKHPYKRNNRICDVLSSVRKRLFQLRTILFKAAKRLLVLHAISLQSRDNRVFIIRCWVDILKNTAQYEKEVRMPPEEEAMANRKWWRFLILTKFYNLHSTYKIYYCNFKHD